MPHPDTAASTLLGEAIASAFFETDDLAGLLHRLVERMRAVAGWSAGECWIASPNGEWVQSGGDGVEDESVQRFLRESRGLRVGSTMAIAGMAAAAGRAVRFEELTEDKGCIRTALMEGTGFAAAFAMPLFEHGRPFAVLVFFEQDTPEAKAWSEVAASLDAPLHAMVLRHRQTTTLDRFFAISATGMVVAGFDGRFHRVNPAFCRMLGRSAEEILATPATDLIHPDDLLSSAAAGERIRDGESVLGFTNRYRHADGGWRTLEWTALPVSSQGVTYATVRDVTEERQRIAMERLQRDAIESIATGRPLVEALDRVVRSVEAMIPGVRGSVLLIEDERLVSGAAPNLPPEYSAAIDQARIGPMCGSCGTAAWRGETVIVTDIRTDPLWDEYRDLAMPHGFIGCWSVPAKDRYGVTTATIAVYTDTPRGPTSSELQVLEGAAGLVGMAVDRSRLDSALQLLSTAIENLNDIVLITSAEPIDGPDGPRIEFVNPAFERITGYTREETIGMTPRILQGPVTDRATLDRIRAALRQWQPIRAEVANVTKDGRTIWLELDISPVADANGWYTHWVAIERDITERKLLEGQLREAQKMEAVGRLAGGVAHDFNNMLTAIQGFAEILELELPDGEHATHLHQIRRAADRSAELVRKLLAFSRRQVMQVRTVDLRTLVQEMGPLLKHLVGEGVTMEVSVGHVPLLATVDPAQVEQVLLNLVVNARDAMPHGGELAILAEHRDTPDGPIVVLAVRDSGVGISPDLHGQIFEPFFTTRGDSGGTGLGLSTVFGIVSQSGGRVVVESEPGRGTTMTVELPMAPEGRRLTPPPVAMPPRGAATGTVLVVEDEEMVRRYVVRMLEREGYRVLEAGDGPDAEALVRAYAEPIDLLLTDVVLPHRNGRWVADTVRQLRPGIAVMFMSGYTQDAIVRQGVLDDGVELLAKPFSREDLLDRVAATLARR